MALPPEDQPPRRIRIARPANAALLHAAYENDLAGVREAIEQGADIEAVHEPTGLKALHIAVGTNNLPLTRYLLEEAGAILGPDQSGRWPTLIAAQCEAGGDLCDYIVEAEAKVVEDAEVAAVPNGTSD